MVFSGRRDDDVAAVVLPARAHGHWAAGGGPAGGGLRLQAQGPHLRGLHRGQVLRHDY